MFASIRSTVVIATTAFLAAGIAAVPASAAAPIQGDTRSVAVIHTDLNLASADGAAVLERRVHRAATKVCGTADTRDLAARQRSAACRTSAIQAARPNVELAIATARGDNRMAAAAPSIQVAAK